jgi:O-methyltransferase
MWTYTIPPAMYCLGCPRLVRGAVVVFDDYGFYGCEGVTRMVDEFVAQNSGYRFLHNPMGMPC